MMQTSSNEPLSVYWLWDRLCESLSSVGESLRPEAAGVRDEFNQFLSRYGQMTRDRSPTPGEQPPQSEEWWLTDAEVCALLLDRITQGMTATGEPPSLEYYRLVMRLSLLVARIESDLAEYFQEEFNNAERSLYV